MTDNALSIYQQLMASRLSPEQIFARNQPYLRPGEHVYNTPLTLPEERDFRSWLTKNSVPFDPGAKVTDYDMRGFYRALQAGHPAAVSAIDPNDNRLHYPDYWKTPYHETFSNESQWAVPMAPRWNGADQLVSPGARILFDDRQQGPPIGEFDGRF